MAVKFSSLRDFLAVAERGSLRHQRVARLPADDDLDQHHLRDRIEEMEPDESVRPRRDRRHRSDREARRVGREDRPRGARRVEGAETGEVGGTSITAHHLLFNRNAIFTGGVRPHYYCLPVLKRETHRQALVRAATGGSPKFFLGTDSAPHPAHLKEHASGCAGCYTAHAAMELYAQAFDAASALDKLEGFASFYGADFYSLPRNSGTITLKRESWTPPESFVFGEASLKPLAAGEALQWRLV